MDFQISRLHRDQTVIGGMAFVESITGEFLPIFVNGFGGVLGHAFSYGAFYEFGPELLDLVLLFL